MGLFDKIKGIINEAKGQGTQQMAQKQEEERKRQEEEKRKQEEEKRKQEEANRFNPDKKSLEWFGSEDGIKTFKEYVTAQNYFLEETIKKEQEDKYSEYSFEAVVSVFYKNEKLPSIYFKKLADAIDVQALKYVGPTRVLVDVLSAQAQPFYIDEDGEPIAREVVFTPEELVSVDKNPALIFVKNFDCFELSDDAQGSWVDKYELWSDILVWIGVFSGSDPGIIAANPWIFSKEVYFNDMGTIRKGKSFYKKCMELTTSEKYKALFEDKYNECE